MKFIKLAILALSVLTAPVAAVAQEMTDARVKELVYQAIRENPEIVMEAVAILQARQARQQAADTANVLSSQRQLLERDPNAPVLGNPDGDVTVVEFFDYNCPYCKRAAPEVEALVAADPNVRLVYREWPILGEGSVYATRASLAARNQGKYKEFHDAMMALKGRANEQSVLRVARQIGLDIDKLKADMQSDAVAEHITTSMRLTEAMGVTGTPAFVIGDAVVPGYVDVGQLKELVGKARAAKK